MPKSPPRIITEPAGKMSATNLRQRAEARLAGTAAAAGQPGDWDPQILIHELQVHQIELEMQNEELRRAQGEAEAARERYFDLFEQAPVGYVILGLDGLIREANSMAAVVLGVPKPALEKMRLQELFLLEDRPRLQTLYREALATKVPQAREVRALRPDRTFAWIRLQMAMSRDVSDEQWICRVTLTDITERVEAEQQTARMAAIVASSADAIISRDPAGVITFWNPAAERLTGYTAHEMLGEPLGTLLLPVPATAAEANNLMGPQPEQAVRQFDAQLQTRAGGSLPVSVTISPILDERGFVSGTSLIARDISERLRSQEALREADQKKDHFIATLAHELRNPMAPIRNGLAILQRQGSPGSQASAPLAMMTRQVNYMVRLLDDLLDISRISRGKITLQRERLAVAAVLHDAVEINLPLLKSQGVRLVLPVLPAPVFVDADPVRLTQVFANLINNAAKYTESGGQIAVTCEIKDTRVEVCVQDTGAGIVPGLLPHIFEIFTQGEAAGGGLGIGLTLVKSLVEMHAGTVRAESAGQGFGSRFYVELPLPDGVDQDQDVASVATPPLAETVHVLLVDDNRDAADSLAQLLSLVGVTVDVRYDGPAALLALDEFLPNAVILDIGMPGMDGNEVARRIRRNPRTQHLPLIALTGWGRPEDIQETKRAGFSAHLVKPADFATLQQLLANLIATHPA